MNSAIIATKLGSRKEGGDREWGTFHRRPQARYCFHPLINSYVEAWRAIVLARKHMAEVNEFTVYFVIIMQVSERVKVDITMERYMRPEEASDRWIHRDHKKPYSTRQYHL